MPTCINRSPNLAKDGLLGAVILLDCIPPLLLLRQLSMCCINSSQVWWPQLLIMQLCNSLCPGVAYDPITVNIKNIKKSEYSHTGQRAAMPSNLPYNTPHSIPHNIWHTSTILQDPCLLGLFPCSLHYFASFNTQISWEAYDLITQKQNCKFSQFAPKFIRKLF